LLESIYYLATTKSPLASTERQIMNWDAEREVIPYARVRGVFVRGNDEHTIEITLAKQSQSEGNGEAGWRRQIHLDGAPRRAIDKWVASSGVVLPETL
jgi:DNA replication and repair protein RecF